MYRILIASISILIVFLLGATLISMGVEHQQSRQVGEATPVVELVLAPRKAFEEKGSVKHVETPEAVAEPVVNVIYLPSVAR